MIRAFGTAASAMVAQSTRQDIIANNIANAQTPGYKRMRGVSTSFAQTLQTSLPDLVTKQSLNYPQAAAQAETVQTDQVADTSAGTIHGTGNRFDFAIDGTGEFEVSSGTSTTITRNGSFRPGAHGELVTQDGQSVMGKTGPIHLPQGDWSVKSDGSIVSNGEVVDKIKLVGADKNTSVMQGSIEDSNVNIVREMVDMISNQRSYEANQKMITNVDQTLGEMITEGGKV